MTQSPRVMLPSSVLECWAGTPAQPGQHPGGRGSSGGPKAALPADAIRSHHFSVPFYTSPGPVECALEGLCAFLLGPPPAQACPKGQGAELPGEEWSATQTTGHLFCLDRRKMLESLSSMESAFRGVGVSGSRPKGTRCKWASSSPVGRGGGKPGTQPPLCLGRARRTRVKCCSERDNTPRQGRGTAGPSPVRAQAPQLCRQREPRL